MKHNLSLIIGAIALAAAAGSNAQTAVTDPVGYITCKVAAAPAGGTALSFISPTLVNKLEFSGAATAATPTSITLTGAAPITADAFKGVHNDAYDTNPASVMPGYYVEVSSGAGEGQWANITANTATALTVDRDLSGAITGGTTVRVRKHATVSEIFGATNTTGLKGSDSILTADEIKVLKPVTHEVKSIYFFDDGLGNTQWTDPDGNNTTDLSIFPDQGIAIQRKTATAVSFVRVGHVKTGKTALYATPGLNILATPRAVGDTFTFPVSNLTNAGPQTTRILGGTQSLGSDIVSLPQDDGSLKSFYFFDDGLGNTQFSDVDNNDATTEKFNEGEAIVINRQPAGGTLTWTVPAQPIAP